jgi:hypothetical protein
MSVSSQGNSFAESRLSSINQQQMPDVRVKKNMTREHVRNSSRQNRANMGASQTAGSNFLPELTDLSSREEGHSPMGSPKKLNVQTKIRNKNAPPLINLNDV